MDTEDIAARSVISSDLRTRTMQDTRRDTLQVMQPGTLQVSRADTIEVMLPDTLSGVRPDSIYQFQTDTVQVAGTDTLQTHIPGREADTLAVEQDDAPGYTDTGTPVPDEPRTTDPPAADTAASVQVDAMQDTTNGLPQSLPAPAYTATQPEVTESPAATYDIPNYAESMNGYEPGRNGLFGNQRGACEDSVTVPVFAGEVKSDLSSGAGASYMLYLEDGVSDQGNNQPLHGTSWIPALVILSFLLLTWIKLIYVQFITPVLVSAFSYREADKLYTAKSSSTQNAFMVLHAIFAINGGIFFLFIADHFNLQLPGINNTLLFLAAAVSLTLIFAVRSTAVRVIAFIFDKSAMFDRYLHNVSLYNKIYGIILLPLIVGLLYAGEAANIPLIYTGLVMAGVFYLLQLLRGLEIALKKGFSLFYMFLYFCAFEFLPLIVLYKLIRIFLFN